MKGEAMVTRGRIRWEQNRENPYEVVVEGVDPEEILRLGAKTRTKVKEYKENRYLKLTTGNVSIIYTTEKGAIKEDKGE
jgi:hypothetical protein